METESKELSNGPLTGITVLDISQGWAGPGATMLLGDQGADVIKVEPIEGDQARGYFANAPINGEERGFLAINRSKRGISLNLKNVKGREILLKLVERSDVFLHNFRPGVAERLEIEYGKLKDVKPDLIYVSMTPFGKKGPYAAQRAYDLVLQSLAGAMRFCRPEARPMVSGIWVSDCSTMMMLAYAITLALFVKQKHGYGQQIDASLFSQTLFMQFPDMVCSAEELGKRVADDFREDLWEYHTPCRCKDGKYIVSVAMTNEQWKSLCKVLGLMDMGDEPRFASPLKRFQQGTYIHEKLEQAFLEKDQTEWLQLLKDADVPHSPVLHREEVFTHPQVLDNQMVLDLDHPKAGPIRMLNVPFTLSMNPGAIQRPSPLLGQHTREILLDLGYSEDHIRTFLNDGVVKTSQAK